MYRGRDRGGSDLAALGLDPNDAVGTAVAEDREGGTVFQNGDLVDLRGRKVGDIVGIDLETVHEDLGRVITGFPVGSNAANEPAGHIVARLSGTLEKGQARELSGEGVGQVRLSVFGQRRPVGRGYGRRGAKLRGFEKEPGRHPALRLCRIGRDRRFPPGGRRDSGREEPRNEKQRYNDMSVHNRNVLRQGLPILISGILYQRTLVDLRLGQRLQIHAGVPVGRIGDRIPIGFETFRQVQTA